MPCLAVVCQSADLDFHFLPLLFSYNISVYFLIPGSKREKKYANKIFTEHLKWLGKV